MSRLRKHCILLVAFTTTFFLFPVKEVEAARFASKSSMKFAVFSNYSAWLVPFPYTWDGLVAVDYTKTYDSRARRYVYTITKVDKSVSMYGAANSGNPCGVDLAISVDVYDGSRRVTTLTGGKTGSYIIGRGTLIYGTVNSTNLQLVNPVFKPHAVAVARNCFGSSAFSWSFGLP